MSQPGPELDEEGLRDLIAGDRSLTADREVARWLRALRVTSEITAESAERERLRRSLHAAEEERRRWARELHDETLQSLGGLRVMLSSARRRDDVESLRAALDGAVTQLGEEITNLRALITELRPAALDELGLRPALEALIERTEAAHGLPIEATLELEWDGPRLNPDIEVAVYRVIQESLNNAARHAEADHVRVLVLRRFDEILITIRDDGRGFDVGLPLTGFGLTGMRERIALVGGRLEISSESTGTTIAAVVPSGSRG